MGVFNERKQTGDMTLKLRNQEEHPDQRVSYAPMNLDVHQRVSHAPMNLDVDQGVSHTPMNLDVDQRVSHAPMNLDVLADCKSGSSLLSAPV